MEEQDPAEPDALLLLSFGGPEQEEDVVPFLENVTRGRGIPRDRLVDVGEHYFALGGRSPLNDLNRDMIDNIREVLGERGMDVPVYFGNRNWHPYVEDTVSAMADDGVRHALVFATSAWGGYSGCRQYHEDIARARAAVQKQGKNPPSLRRLRQFHDHPRFIGSFAEAVDAARDSLVDGNAADLVFTAHSIPARADREAGPESDGGELYSRQVRDSARLIREHSTFAAATRATGEVVWQSRSGPPSVPWLEPDVCDHLRERVNGGNTRPVVLCPVGFLSDHVEVLWDLDTEARDVADELGIELARAGTPGPTRDFARLVVDLMEEVTSSATAQRPALGEVANFGSAVNGNFCARRCCGGSTASAAR